MALIDCPECGKPVSTAAHACPNCGYPVADKISSSAAPHTAPRAQEHKEPLAEVRPSWWLYFWHLFFFFLVIPPIVACFRRASTILRIFPDRITVERGIFSKCYQDYNPRDIRSIDIDQSFGQRLVGIGDMTISTAATEEGAEEIRGIPNPKAVRELILGQRGEQSDD